MTPQAFKQMIDADVRRLVQAAQDRYIAQQSINDDDIYIIDIETRTIVRNLGRNTAFSAWASDAQNRAALGLLPNQVAMRGMRAKGLINA